MIVVIGSVVAQPGMLEDMLALSREHVTRSRAEPGCESHAVYIDTENRMRLVFVEEWTDQAALRQHFAVPASGQFIKALRTLASEAPVMRIYEAARLSL
jgi:quinol monooxygenase YgiN